MAEVTVFHNAAELEPVTAKGWRMGFANVFKREMERVWNIKTFLIHSLVWMVLINMILALVIELESNSGLVTTSFITYVLLSGVLVPMGAAVITAGALIGEKITGTAAWILSKPVSRSGFVIAKFIALSSSILVTAVVLQGVIAYAQLSLAQQMFIPVSAFLGAFFTIVLAVIFYISLSLMLGTMFNSRVPVMGIPLALILIQIFLLSALENIAEWLPYVLPGSLLSIGTGFVTSEGGEYWPLTVFITLALSAFFIYMALHRINREEL
ncbi:MAG: ABC transporter permease subunit [Dehalogenimonas sp.]|uniref:ABC transporter permease subunit n=1 Tax=Candidatus Dehalogenimonas loeffleri TaxID=3127115 RepID=A0ABZ2J2S8_9CHLR|nr:ABC transporter permease subunit [Dehalogenimonas sp.]